MTIKEWIDIVEGGARILFLVAVLVFGVPLLRRYRIKSLEVLGVRFELIERELRHAEAKQVGTAGWALSRDDLDSIRDRALRLADRLRQAHVLWIDDKHPGANIHERRALGGLGVSIDMVRTTTEAEALLASAPYDVVVTNYSRDDDQGAAKLLSKTARPPVVFYAGKPRQTPDGAFGYTIRPDQLLHLVMDAVERIKKPVAG